MAISNSAIGLLFTSFAETSAIFKTLLFLLAWMGVWLPLAIPLAIIQKWQPLQPITVQQKLPLLVSLYLLAPLVVWGMAKLEGVPFSSYGFVWRVSTLSSFGLGLLIAILGLTVLLGLQSLLGWIRFEQIQQTQLTSILLPTLFLAIWVSATEELVFRGVLVNELQQDYSLGLAAAIASLIFALLHLIWEGRDTIPQLPGLWLMGMVLVLARWVDHGSLGLACGLHAGWIWGIASLDSAQLLVYTNQGPEWMTGLAQKPLAGGLGLLFLLGTGAMLWPFL